MNTAIYAKYVYLFEMDSVRTTAAESNLAVRALYHETIVARNIVALTYNQVVDSVTFISMLKEQDSFEDIFHLFELGYLKITQFGSIRTLIQYLLDKLEPLLDESSKEEEQFLFSGLPIKKSQRRLIALIRRCLINSDLSEIYEYVNGGKTSEELIDLFSKVKLRSALTANEQRASQTENWEIINKHWVLMPPSDSAKKLKETLDALARVLGNLLKLSAITDIYLPPKRFTVCKEMTLSYFLNLVDEACKTNSAHDPLFSNKRFQNAMKIIRGLKPFKSDKSDPTKHSEKRSEYHEKLKEDEFKEKKNKQNKGQNYWNKIQEYRYAESIIDTCYNFTCEANILNISRHYDLRKDPVDGLWVPEEESFLKDFAGRVRENMKTMVCYMEKGETPDDHDTIDYIMISRFPRLDHLKTPDSRVLYCEAPEPMVPRYEYKKDSLFNRTKLGRIFDYPNALLRGFLAFSLLVVTNLLMDRIQNYLPPIHAVLSMLIRCIFVIFVGEAINSFISELIPAYNGSLFETLGSAVRYIGNEIYNWNMFSMKPYTSSVPGRSASEYQCCPVSDSVTPVPESRAMRRYKEVRKDTQGWPFFNDPADAGYRFYRTDTGTDVEKENSIKDLYRYEELTGRQFGLIHQSKFSTLLVDPVLKPGKVQNIKNLMSYERVLPGKLPPAGKYDGVVIIPRLHGRYVLITQYRHALRRDQLCFPRGFADEKCIYDDLKRELDEEIGVTVEDNNVFHFLGSITPDSGLTSKTAAVYLADLDSVGQSNDPHEAIKKSGLYTAEDIFAMIGSGEIDDGFTVSAAMFLKLELQHMRP